MHRSGLFHTGVLALLLIIFFAKTVLAEDSCEAAVQYINIDLKIDPGQVRYYNTYDREYLSRLFKSMGSFRAGWTPVGLTAASFGYSYALSLQTYQMSSGLYCSEIDFVEIAVGYENIDVYVAQKYAPGSCQYNSVLEHEKRHLGIYQGTLEEHASVIEVKLRSFMDRQEQIITEDPEIAIKVYQNNVGKALKPLVLKIQKYLDKRHGKLDTMENYLKEQKHCKSW